MLTWRSWSDAHDAERVADTTIVAVEAPPDEIARSPTLTDTADDDGPRRSPSERPYIQAAETWFGYSFTRIKSLEMEDTIPTQTRRSQSSLSVPVFIAVALFGTSF